MINLDERLKDLDLEFLAGVPVSLTDEMIMQISSVVADYIESIELPKQLQFGGLYEEERTSYNTAIRRCQAKLDEAVKELRNGK